MSFVLSFLSFSFKLREREREGVYKTGYKEKRSQSLLIFFSFRRGSCGKCFLFYGLIDFMLFLILAWRSGSFVSEIFFSSSFTRSTWLFGSVCHEPCPTTNLFLFLFSLTGRRCHFRFLGSQPIIWLLPSSFPCQATRGRSPSTNICS